MKSIFKFILTALLFFTLGCISWDEGWKAKVQGTGQGDIKALLASVTPLEASADSGDKVKNIIAIYEKINSIEPGKYETLSKLGEYTFLYSYIYVTDKKVKEEYYIKSLQYCEQAMYTNPEFKKLADQGKPAWECADVLTTKEMESMFYWYVAAGQYWTECHNSVSRLLNFYWPSRTKRILDKMTALDPNWQWGRVHMSWGAFYAIIPGFLGGDLKKSAEEFDKAIKVEPDALNNYYVRARYLHVKNGDREAFKKDLDFILSKDLKKINFLYRWGAAYQLKSKELLGEIDKLF